MDNFLFHYIVETYFRRPYNCYGHIMLYLFRYIHYNYYYNNYHYYYNNYHYNNNCNNYLLNLQQCKTFNNYNEKDLHQYSNERLYNNLTNVNLINSNIVGGGLYRTQKNSFE